MKRIFEPRQVAAAIARSRYSAIFEGLPVSPFLIRYDAGEFAVRPDDDERLLLIVVEGALSIYYIRDDGSRFALAAYQRDAIIGESCLFGVVSQGIYAEATEPLTCIAIDLSRDGDALLSDAPFLRAIAGVQAAKLDAVATQDAAPLSLKARVLSYMRCKCPEGRLKGVENAAFHLHCSPRQLQRILNAYEREGIIRKVDKGTYCVEVG